MAEFYDVDRLTNDQTGDIFHLKDYSLGKEVSSPAPIVSFPDGAPYPMSLIAAIDPVQDLHGYDHPWPGGGGKNLLPNEISTATESGVTFTTQLDGKITVSGTSTSSIYETDICQNFSLPAGEYILSYDAVTNLRVQICNRAETQEYLAVGWVTPSRTLTVTSEMENDMRVRFVMDNGKAVSGTTGVMIRPSTVSDATFAPYSNICPISGFDGANVYRSARNLLSVDQFKTYSNWKADLFPYGDYPTTDSNKGYKLNVETGVQYTLSFGFSSSNFPSYFYLCSSDGTSTRRDHTFTTSSYNDNSFTFTPASGRTYYIRIGGTSSSSFVTVMGRIPYTQLEKGGSVTASDPVTKYPITFPSAAGTVYGGAVTVNPDGTGELVVDRKAIELGSQLLSWSYISQSAAFFANVPSDFPSPNPGGHYGISTIYKAFVGSYTNFLNEDYKFQISNSNSSSSKKLTLRDSRYTDITTLLNNVGNELIVYPLDSPETYQLTHGQVKSILGQNNVWADTGDIQSLSYVRNTVPELIRQDTTGQISSALDPVESSLAIVIDGDVAVGGLDSGKYVFLRSHSTLARGLYHTTSAIADGASITGNNTEPDSQGGLNTIETVGITPANNTISVDFNSTKKILNRVVVGTFRLSHVSINAGTWTTIATLNQKPSEDVSGPYTNGTDAVFGGTYKLYTNGQLDIYSASGLSNRALFFTVAYAC